MSNLPNRPGSDEEWAALMRQLRLQPEAQPRPFFYARVRARLAAELPAENSWLLGWARRPAYLALLGALVLAVSGDGASLPSTVAVNQYHAHPAGPLAPRLPH